LRGADGSIVAIDLRFHVFLCKIALSAVRLYMRQLGGPNPFAAPR